MTGRPVLHIVDGGGRSPGALHNSLPRRTDRPTGRRAGKTDRETDRETDERRLSGGWSVVNWSWRIAGHEGGPCLSLPAAAKTHRTMRANSRSVVTRVSNTKLWTNDGHINTKSSQLPSPISPPKSTHTATDTPIHKQTYRLTQRYRFIRQTNR